MASEKQITANRLNAQKSTGPVTAEGKARSAKNALKHGMTARNFAALTPEDQVEMNLRMEQWAPWLVDGGKDGNPVALDMVALGVNAYQRVKNCQNADTAAAAQRMRHAERRWDLEKQEEVSKLVSLMNNDSMSAVAALKCSVAGCDYLITAWKALLGSLDSKAWYEPCHKRARQLLGYDNNDPKSSIILPDAWQDHLGRYMEAYRLKDTPIAFMSWHFRVMRVENIELAVEHDKAVFLRLQDMAIPCDEAYTAMMKKEISDLEAQRAFLVPIEEADRAEARIRAMHDDSPSGKLRQRYMNDGQRDIYRALREIRLIQQEFNKSGRVVEFEADEAAEPVAQNEAKSGTKNGYSDEAPTSDAGGLGRSTTILRAGLGGLDS